LRHGARTAEFGGREMPLYYQKGMVREHMTIRKKAGLFDVFQMGRFIICICRALIVFTAKLFLPHGGND
jgi:glycine cleavage system aminomethyltransferase T